MTETDVYIGVGSQPTIHKSFKAGLIYAYNFVKDHPRTTAYINVVTKGKNLFVENLTVDGRKTPVASSKETNHQRHILKSDGTLGKKIVDSGRRRRGWIVWTVE